MHIHTHSLNIMSSNCLMYNLFFCFFKDLWDLKTFPLDFIYGTHITIAFRRSRKLNHILICMLYHKTDASCICMMFICQLK